MTPPSETEPGSEWHGPCSTSSRKGDREMKILLGLSVALLAVGCGKARQAVEQRFEEPALMKTWEAPCVGTDIVGLSERTYVKFGGASFTKVQTFYSNGHCTDESV